MVTFPSEEDVTTPANLWHNETLPQAVTLVNYQRIALMNDRRLLRLTDPTGNGYSLSHAFTLS
jgi:hypothetical protein